RPTPVDRRVPAWLRAAVVRGLAPEAADRWPSIDALLAHVAARRRRPRRAGITIAALGVAAIGAIAIVLATRTPAREPAPPRFVEGRVTQRGDVQAATLAFDGHHLAMITAGGELIVTD